MIRCGITREALREPGNKSGGADSNSELQTSVSAVCAIKQTRRSATSVAGGFLLPDVLKESVLLQFVDGLRAAADFELFEDAPEMRLHRFF